MIDEEERKIPDEFIETIDVWALRSLRWPVMRVLSRHFVEERELRRYERGLLATGRWTLVRVAPHQSDAGTASTHVFDVYGRRSLNSARNPRDAEVAMRGGQKGSARNLKEPCAIPGGWNGLWRECNCRIQQQGIQQISFNGTEEHAGD